MTQAFQINGRNCKCHIRMYQFANGRWWTQMWQCGTRNKQEFYEWSLEKAQKRQQSIIDAWLLMP